jgi:hypothetical protein
MCTINKLPNAKSDLVRTDEDWEEWKMESLVDSLQKWLRRNKTEEDKSTGDPRRREKTCLNVKEVKRTKEEKRHLVVCSVKLNTGVICASLM